MRAPSRDVTPPESHRPGVVVDPVQRISADQVVLLHEASMGLLSDPGLVATSEEAVAIFRDADCRVDRGKREGTWTVRIPRAVVDRALESTPSTVVLGARDPANTLLLEAHVPRVYFGTGSEANVVLEMSLAPSDGSEQSLPRTPVYSTVRGSLRGLADAARLCDALPHCDFFIRNVNVQDDDIDESNKDVNVAFASLRYMTKHVQTGLVSVKALPQVMRVAEIVAGGPEKLRKAPPISFIACLVKSPLEMLEGTTQKAIEIARQGLPLVISSSPQGGSTGPIQEEGIVAMINAEILAGVTLTQLVNPGTPVLYGAVPVRARLDTLHDLYGAPELIHYNVDCVQLARYYELPCYSTAGVGDSSVPGLGATIEKVFSQLAVAQSGAHYIHYAFGLLARTGTFCPVQAVIDDANIAVVKDIVRCPTFDGADVDAAVAEIRKVMGSSMQLFTRHVRKQIRRGVVCEPYGLEGEGEGDEVLGRAAERLASIRADEGRPLAPETIERIHGEIPGLVDEARSAL